MPSVHETGVTRTVIVGGSGTFAHDPPVLPLTHHYPPSDPGGERDVEYEKELKQATSIVYPFPHVANNYHWNGGTKLHTFLTTYCEPQFVNRGSVIGSLSHPVKYTDNGDDTWDIWLEISFKIWVYQGYLLSANPVLFTYSFTSDHTTRPTKAPGSPSPYPFEMTEGEVLTSGTGLIFRPSLGGFDFTYTAVLYKMTDGHQIWENFRLTQMEIDGAFDARFTFLDIDAIFTANFNYSQSYPATFIPSLFADGEHTLEFFGLGPTYQQIGNLGYSDSSFVNSSGELIEVFTDYLKLTGNPQQGTFWYIGDDFIADTILAPDFPADTHLRSAIQEAPSARIYASPSWSVGVEGEFVDYEDASLIDLTLVHETRHRHTGGTIVETEEWNAFDGFLPIPAAGQLDALTAEITSEGRCYDPTLSEEDRIVYVSLFVPETEDGHPTFGAVSRPWKLLETPYDIPEGETHIETLHSFYIQDADANAQGLYTKSANRILKHLNFGATKKFDAGTIAVAATKTYNLFDVAAFWVVPGNSAFYLANPDISSLGVVSQVGGTTRFTHGIGGARALFRHSAQTFKPYSHRYNRILHLPEAAGEKFRFGLGRLPFGSNPAYYYRYAWEWESVGAVPEFVEIDLCRPTHKASVSATGVVTVSPTTDIIHPSTFLEGVNQNTTAWFEMLTTGQVDVDYIEGFFETSGDRTAALLYHGMLATGNQISMGNYETGTAPSPTPYWLIYAPNGAAGTAVVGQGSISSAWAGLRALIGNGVSGNDTGFTVVAPTHALSALDSLNADDFTYHAASPGTPFGEVMTPGSATQVRNRIRLVGQLFSGVQLFYGAGDPTLGLYSSHVLLRSQRLLRGEARVVIPNPDAGDQLTFHDDPTGALLYTADVDDDGAARAFLKYGVPRPRSNSSAASSAGDPVEFSGASPPYTYTNPLGRALNAYWAKPVGWSAEVDGAGYLADASDLRTLITVLDGWPNWFGLVVAPVTGRTPANVEDRWGRYHRVTAQEGRIRYRRAAFGVPPFVVEVFATEGTEDTHPRIIVDSRDTARILFGRGADGGPALELASNDDGATWEVVENVFLDVKFPTIVYDRRFSIVYRFAYDGGVILGVREYADGSTETFTVEGSGGALAVEDDSFEFAWKDGTGWGAVRLDGAGDVSVLRSDDNGATWTEFVSLLTGCEHPTLAFGRMGDLVVAARTAGGNIRAAVLEAGATNFGAEFLIEDEAGDPIEIADDTFHLAAAWEEERRGVLTAVVGTETEASEAISADDWRSFERVG